MNKVSMDKKYKTRNGCDVRILCVDMKNKNYQVVGIVTDKDGEELEQSFTSSGQFINTKDEHKLDLIEVSPYADFKIDDKVSYDNKTYGGRGHFAGLDNNGNPMVWQNGGTSFTQDYRFHVLKCELYKEE